MTATNDNQSIDILIAKICVTPVLRSLKFAQISSQTQSISTRLNDAELETGFEIG